MAVNNNDTATFFEVHFAAAPPATFIYICGLPPKGAGNCVLKPILLFFPVTEPGRAARACLELSSRGLDVYFGVQPRLSQTGGGGSNNVAGVITIPVDNDVADPACVDSNCVGNDRADQTKLCGGCHYRDGRPKLRSREEAHDRYASLALAGLPVSDIIVSGRGLHGYFHLKEMIPIDAAVSGALSYSDVTTSLGQSVYGDSISDVPRILRPAGTHNRKPGREASLVEWQGSRPDVRYGSLEDVYSLIPAALHADAGSRPTAASRAIPLPIEVPEHIRRAFEVTKWRSDVKRDKGAGGIVALVIRDRCPYCMLDPRSRKGAQSGTAYVTPFGFLRCHRSKCVASIQPGIPYEVWVAQIAPDALWSYSSVPTIELAPEDRCTRSESEARLGELVEQAVAFAEAQPGNIAILSATPGAGKTRAVLERFVREGRGSLVGLSHPFLDEREREAKSLGLSSRRRRRGILSRRDPDDMSACVYQKELKPWADRGYSIRNNVCATCSHRTNYRETETPCPAYKGVDGRGVVFAVHAHGPALAEQDQLKPPIFLDECPSLVETIHIGAGELDAIIKEGAVADLSDSNLHAEWCAERAPLGRVVRLAMNRMIADVKTANERYTRRISGIELRRRLGDAARELTIGRQKLLLDEAEVGLKKLDEIARQMALAHAGRPAPPPALGVDMRSGAAPQFHFEVGYAFAALDSEGREKRSDAARQVACLCANKSEAWIEWRKCPLDRWNNSEGNPLSMVILDATAPILIDAIRAALPGRYVQLFRLEVDETANVTRVFASTSSLTRRALFAFTEPEPRLTDRAGVAIARMIKAIGRRIASVGVESASVGVITHLPLAKILTACANALGEKADVDVARAEVEKMGALPVVEAMIDLRESRRIGHWDVLWYGGQRGSNLLSKCDALFCLGDPWSDIGAIAEDARFLGIEKDAYTSALRDAEMMQALGRARAIRRTDANPVILIAAGKHPPLSWRPPVRVEILHLPRGGPCSSDVADDYADLVWQAVDRWGAASPSLIRLAAESPDVANALGQNVTTAIKGDPIIAVTSFWSRATSTVGALSERAQQRIFTAQLGYLPEVTVADPTRPVGSGGYWKLREARPGAAERIAAVVRSVIQPAASTTYHPDADVDATATTAASDFAERVPPFGSSSTATTVQFESACFCGAGCKVRCVEGFEQGWPIVELFDSD